MAATIIPFPSHRFTIVDAARLHEVASAMIATGIWGRVQYLGAAKGPGFDTVLIYLPESSSPIFVIERQKNGSYSIVDCTTMSVMANARTLDGAFAPLETVIRLAETAEGPGDLERLRWNIW